MPRKALKPVVPGAVPPVEPIDPSTVIVNVDDYDDTADPLPVPVVEGTSKASLGDHETYKHLPAHKVDARKIDRPVLTRDGWVLPLPKATPE